MTDVLLLTADALPRDDEDMEPLVRALAARGVRGLVRSWTDPSPLPDAAFAVVRSTWDYAARRAEFLATLTRLADTLPVHNPVPVLAWNSHKGYLVELAEAGVPVVPSVLVRQGDPVRMPDPSAGNVVIKPAVSAGAVGVGLFAAGSPAAQEHLERLTATGDALVQPFQESVRDGERSLLFFAGELSHAVRKVPAAQDFRVQERHGGRNEPHAASAADLEVAQRALAAAAPDLLYARVDLVGPQDAPLLMELELIEPGLFLPLGPGAADRFAGAIADRLDRA